MNRRAAYCGAAMALILTAITAANARPPYLNTFKAHYKTATGKPTLNAANCAMCHIGAPPMKNFNAFGMAFAKSLGAPGVNDPAKISAAFDAAAKLKNPTTNETFGDRIAKDALPAGTAAVGGGGGGGVSGTWVAAYNGLNTDGWTKMGGDWSIKNGSIAGTGGSLVSGKDYKNFSLVVVAKGNGAIQLPSGEVAISGSDWTNYQITVQDGIRSLAVNGQVSGGEVAGAANAGKVGIKSAGNVEVAQIWIMELP